MMMVKTNDEIVQELFGGGSYSDLNRVEKGRVRTYGRGPEYQRVVIEILDELAREGKVHVEGGRLNTRSTQEKPRSWISFAWTTRALIEGHKLVTRRTWTDNYAAQFNQGDLVTVYDKRPNWGGRPVAIIRLTQTPYRQMSDKVSQLDWKLEGFAWMEAHGMKVGKVSPKQLWKQWHDEPENFWVIRFEVVEIL
jgi:hypothetical protein